MEEMTTGLCPKCGHALQIPVELEQFSCMYCGERLSRQQLLTEPGAEYAASFSGRSENTSSGE